MSTKRISSFALSFVLAISAGVNGEVYYTVIDIGNGYPVSINDKNQIVGSSYLNGTYRAILYDSTGSHNNIELGYGAALSINDNGQIVGAIAYGSRLGGALLFDPTGNGNNIYLGGHVATSINNNDEIVGHWGRAILYDSSGNQNNIYLSSYDSAAYSINDNGQIVGRIGDQAAIFDKKQAMAIILCLAQV